MASAAVLYGYYYPNPEVVKAQSTVPKPIRKPESKKVKKRA